MAESESAFKPPSLSEIRRTFDSPLREDETYPGEPDPELRMMVEAPALVGNERRYPFTFTGDWKDYFRIWAVNTFLTILTLGLWSPWAKIRKKKWFLGNTWVAQSNFDYQANPWPILRGRLIAAAAFFVYWMSGNFQPHYAKWVALGIAIVAPVLVIGSIRFNLSNTSYRNLRFSSRAKVSDGILALAPFAFAAAVSLAFPVEFSSKRISEFFTLDSWRHWISPLVFVCVYPYVHGALRLLVLNKSRFGSVRTYCSTRVRTFYSSHIRGSIIGLAMVAIALALIGGVFAYLGRVNSENYHPTVLLCIVLAFISPIMMASLLWYAATQTRLINGTYNLTRIGENIGVRSEIRTWPMAKLYFQNSIAVILSLGLAIPWAAVRTARQRVETTSLAMTGDIDGVVAREIGAYDPTADAAADFFSMDVSL